MSSKLGEFGVLLIYVLDISRHRLFYNACCLGKNDLLKDCKIYNSGLLNSSVFVEYPLWKCKEEIKNYLEKLTIPNGVVIIEISPECENDKLKKLIVDFCLL
jgi:hypothetical protein